tara:strand:- start:19369 stop:19584 length:216 start_codon:yes stop_codon:yes gene_type:complete
MSKTFKNLKKFIDEANSSVTDLLKLYNDKSAELEKASQLNEDLSKKLLASEKIKSEARKEIELLINYVKNN